MGEGEGGGDLWDFFTPSGGLRGISNPQIPSYPPFLKGGRRGYEKIFDARY
jgi:hypothetical protein